MAKTVNFSNGVSTGVKTGALFKMPAPNPAKVIMFAEDFIGYEGPAANGSGSTSGGWVLTEVATGVGNTYSVASRSGTGGNGGVLRLTTDNAANDAESLQRTGESFLVQTTKELWFECRIAVGDITNSTVVIGLMDSDTTPFDVTHGIFFQKATATGAVTLQVENGNTATSTAVTTLANDTFVKLGFWYNGTEIKVYADDVHVATVTSMANLPTDAGDELTPTIGIRTDNAAAENLDVDYIMAAMER